jgi:hypothetical protein
LARARTTSIPGGDRTGLDQGMTRCRIYGHAWEEFYPDNLGTPLYGWRLSLRCTRCTTERHDTIDHIGQISQRRYIYADGYQTEPGEEKPSREEMRLTMFNRIRSRLNKANAIGEMEEAS